MRVIRREQIAGYVQSEVSTLRIGQGPFVTLPEQAFYDVGLDLKQRMDRPYKSIVGQGNDEVSYIMLPWRWGQEEGYEEGVLLGPQTCPTIEAAIPWRRPGLQPAALDRRCRTCGSQPSCWPGGCVVPAVMSLPLGSR